MDYSQDKCTHWLPYKEATNVSENLSALECFDAQQKRITEELAYFLSSSLFCPLNELLECWQITNFLSYSVSVSMKCKLVCYPPHSDAVGLVKYWALGNMGHLGGKNT